MRRAGGSPPSTRPPARRSPRPCWPTRPASSPPAPPRGTPSAPGRPRPPRARAGGRAHRPDRRGQQGGTGRAGHPRDRQAAGRVARRGAGDHRHLLFFRARAAASTARPCPARCATSSSSPSACRSGSAAIITAGNFPVAVPSWYLVPALLCGNAVVWKPAEYTPAIADARSPSCSSRGGLPAGVLNTVLADGPATYDGLSAALDDGLVQKIGFTGSSAVGRAHRRARRPPPADAVPGAGRQEPARRDARRRPRPGRRGRAVLRLRHRGPALHLARHRDRARVGARRVPRPVRRPPCAPPRSATRPATCSTGR